MAVTRLVGYADELVIDFSLDVATREWVATVPKEMIDGTYIFDCIAYDEAGNTDYSCKMLFTFDTKNLDCKLEKVNYFGDFKKVNYYGKFAEVLM